jgi:cytochrome c-type biogenesis protein CcmH
MKKFVMILFLICFSNVSEADIQVFDFNDEQLEKRFKHLTAILRCPKCQNQNLADSNSSLSQDLKQIVYEKLIAGESDKNILSFMKQRYGEFILFEPELNRDNAFLWTAPLIFLLLILFGFIYWYKNNRRNFTRNTRESDNV